MRLKLFTALVIKAFLLAPLLVQSVFSEDIQMIGAKEHRLTQNINSSPSSLFNKNNEKIIQLLKVQLSNEAKELLLARANDAATHSNLFLVAAQNDKYLSIPAKIQLDMNNVPVLDQGIHGTCVTFAVTGAMDAVLNKGDYISQLCHLQLGSYLEKHGYGQSGWDGSFAINVINQLQQYGMVTTVKQKKIGCGGLTQYPAYSARNKKLFMEPEQYRALSELVFGQSINWSDVYQNNNPVKNLNEVKEALNAGDRLVFATLLPRTDLGTAGAVGKYKTWIYKDSWVLTPEILKGVKSVDSAHELIITGYDDDAIAVDNYGVKHKGLLSLRNSWGTSLGNYGEFYMSYDYFKLLAFDLTRFSPSTI